MNNKYFNKKLEHVINISKSTYKMFRIVHVLVTDSFHLDTKTTNVDDGRKPTSKKPYARGQCLLSPTERYQDPQQLG